MTLLLQYYSFFYKSEWHQVLLLPNNIKDEFLQSTIDFQSSIMTLINP